MTASPVRVDRPLEGHPRGGGHAVQRGLAADLVEPGVERLRRVEPADDGGVRQARDPALLVRTDGLSIPTHEHMFAYGPDGRMSARRDEQADLLTEERLARRLGDRDVDVLARPGKAGEVDHLVVARAAAQAARVGARGALDEDLDRPADEALRTLAGAPLDHLDEPLHPLDLLRVRDGVVESGRRGAAARGEDEREGAVVADLLGDGERLGEVG